MSKKWNELYSTEQELIDDMMKTFSNPDRCNYNKLVRGYGYIESFKNIMKRMVI